MAEKSAAAPQANEPVDLRYVDADSVRCAAGSLSHFAVCTADAEALGNVEGVLISPSLRRLQYLVVEKRGIFHRHRYLVPVENAVVQQQRNTLRISARKDELELQEFDSRQVPQFSDQDLITTVFTQHAA